MPIGTANVLPHDYPEPEDEQERLDALKRYEILDTPPEDTFDRLTRLASQIFDVPVALISLIDEDRQWWKSCVGVDKRGTDRELAFCNFPVSKGETVVIPDATKDERVRENPLVTGEMNIRSYAGEPLRTEDGHILGTFCLIDREPRDYNETELDQLRTLAVETMSQLQLRRKSLQLEHKNAQLRLYERAMESTKEGIVISDPSEPDNPIVNVNRGFLDITGYDREEVIGRNCRFLQGPETEEENVDVLREAVENEEPVEVRLRNYRKDGTAFWNQLSITPVRDDDGTLTHFVGVQTDVTDKKKIEDELRHRATYDDLTGLLNRDEFMNRLRDEFDRAHRYDYEGTFLLLDLDHFKDINDEHGHSAGDRVLEEVGTILREATRSSDLCGRYGGEEFCLYLPQTGLEDGIVLAKRICEQIREPEYSGEETDFSCTSSAGVSVLHSEDGSISDPLKRADEALYRAKENGRDQVVAYEKSELAN